MTRGLTKGQYVVALLLFVIGAAACGDDSEPDTSGGGSGGGGSGPCGAMGQACCNGTACNSGLVCQSGICREQGYTTAELYIYVCPDYYTQGCDTPRTWALGSSECYPVPSFEAGQWNATGIEVSASMHYALSSCDTADCYDCGQPGTVNTPSQFSTPQHCGPSWMCNSSSCTQPACPY